MKNLIYKHLKAGFNKSKFDESQINVLNSIIRRCQFC